VKKGGKKRTSKRGFYPQPYREAPSVKRIKAHQFKGSGGPKKPKVWGNIKKGRITPGKMPRKKFLEGPKNHPLRPLRNVLEALFGNGKIMPNKELRRKEEMEKLSSFKEMPNKEERPPIL